MGIDAAEIPPLSRSLMLKRKCGHRFAGSRHIEYYGREMPQSGSGSARYYAKHPSDNPWSCSWLSVDPLAKKYPGWSPYNYVSDNPERNVDELGLSNNDSNNKRKLSFAKESKLSVSGSEALSHTVEYKYPVPIIDNPYLKVGLFGAKTVNMGSAKIIDTFNPQSFKLESVTKQLPRYFYETFAKGSEGGGWGPLFFGVDNAGGFKFELESPRFHNSQFGVSFYYNPTNFRRNEQAIVKFAKNVLGHFGKQTTGGILPSIERAIETIQ